MLYLTVRNVPIEPSWFIFVLKNSYIVFKRDFFQKRRELRRHRSPLLRRWVVPSVHVLSKRVFMGVVCPDRTEIESTDRSALLWGIPHLNCSPRSVLTRDVLEWCIIPRSDRRVEWVIRGNSSMFTWAVWEGSVEIKYRLPLINDSLCGCFFHSGCVWSSA